MVIGLTWQQLQAARFWATDRHKQYLDANRQITKRGHECAMPPVAWLTLAEILRDKSFHASGRHRKTATARAGAVGTRTACTKIWNEIATLQLHPALRGERFIGGRGDVLLAWPIDSMDTPWTVFPNGKRPMILVPQVSYMTFSGPLRQEFPELVTAWKAQPLGSVEVEGAFLNPADHAGWSSSSSSSSEASIT